MTLSSTLIDGINLFIQQTPLRQLENKEKWIKDEEDLRIELSRIVDLIQDTAPMMGKQLWRNKPYRFHEDALLTHYEALTRGTDDTDTALRRKHWLPMMHTVIEPVYEHLGALSHQEALDHVNSVVDAVYEHVKTAAVKMHLDDALVAEALIKASIKQREEMRKMMAAQQAKEKRRKKKKEIEELLAPEPVVEEDD